MESIVNRMGVRSGTLMGPRAWERTGRLRGATLPDRGLVGTVPDACHRIERGWPGGLQMDNGLAVSMTYNLQKSLANWRSKMPVLG